MNLKILEKNITEVYLENNKIEYKKINIDFYLSKYSSVKKKSLRLFVDNNVIATRKTKITYKCSNCHNVSTIELRKYLEKTTHKCTHCKELDLNKRFNHSIKMKNNQFAKGISKIKDVPKPALTLEENLNKSLVEFNLMDNEFKFNFYKKHLTSNEYDLFKHKIKKCNNISINKCSKLVIAKTNNQIKFTTKILQNKKLITCNTLMFKCEKCDDNYYNTKSLKENFNKFKLYCRECSLCNNTFKIRITKNIKGEKIKYQSKLELKFVKFCNDNNIILENGPTILYDNDKHKYRIDFYLPNTNVLIEIKSNHHWHKKQVESGKWNKKVSAAYKLVENKTYNNFLVFFEQDIKNLYNGSIKI